MSVCAWAEKHSQIKKSTRINLVKICGEWQRSIVHWILVKRGLKIHRFNSVDIVNIRDKAVI